MRYFPFSYNDTIKNKRKFDNELNHELRILEELFYYTYDDPTDKADHNYIIELKAELKKDGYIRDDRVIKTFSLKEGEQYENFYKGMKIWYNKQIDNPNRKKETLDDIKRDFFVPYKVKELGLTEQEIDFEKQEDLQRLHLQEKKLKTISIKFKDIEKHIVQKAINIKAKQENSLFQFAKLEEELDIGSIEQLQTEKMADFEIKIIASNTTDYEDIDNREKLNLVIKFLDAVFGELRNNITPKIGSEFMA